MDDELKEIKDLLVTINEKLDFLQDEAIWNKKQWKDSQSFEHYLKRWGGFYLANILADETLG